MKQPSAANYDSELSREARKARGIFYTPSYVAEYMIQRTLGTMLDPCRTIEELLKVKVCDPACGVGFFLRSAQEHMIQWALSHGLRGDEGARASLEAKIQRQCLFGSDIDPCALALAAESLPMANLRCIDALQPGIFGSSKFDIVLGNPPYGAESARGGDSARHFMELAVSLLKADGLHAFIVPKAFLYSSSWKDVLERFFAHISEIVDCGKVWPEVKLEQVIYFYGRASGAAHYLSTNREGERFLAMGLLEKSSLAEFGFALNGVSERELELGRKIKKAGAFFGEHIVNRRGIALQSVLSTEKTGLPVYGGRQISRYGIAKLPRGFIDQSKAEQIGDGYVPANCILLQNIVAHVQNPHAHLKVTAAMTTQESGPLLVLDTVNRLLNRGRFPVPYLLALLNSRLVAWYVYRFIVGRAIRTIHFDSPISNRIPLPCDPKPALVRQLESAASSMTRSISLEHDRRIEELVFELYGLSAAEVALFFGEGVGREP